VLLFKQCVCVCEIIERKSSLLCGTSEKRRRKKRVRFFSLVQDTHKEINWGFL
jgi:hypothetical protein